MSLSRHQVKEIEKLYPKKSAQQIARELRLKTPEVYKALGLETELLAFRIENMSGYIVYALFLCAPFVFLRGLSDYADLPQRVFIQAGAVCLLLLRALKVLITREVSFPGRPVLFAAIAACICWPFVTLLWAHNGYEGFYIAVHWAACAMIFFTLITLPYSDRLIEKCLLALFAAGTGTVILGLCQQFFNITWIPQSAPPAAVLANTNVAAEYVAMVLPLIIAAGLYKKKTAVMGCASLISALLALVFLFYTHCRSSAVALACAVIWAGLLLAKRKLRKEVIKKAYPFVFILLAVCAAIPFAGGWLDRGSQFAGGSAQYRITVWKNSLEMVKEKPLLGFGVGGFKLFYPGYMYKADIDMAFDKKTQIRRAHNDFVQAAVETGIPGLSLFLAVLISGLAMAWRLVKPGNVLSQDAVVIGVSAGIVSFMATAMFGFPFQRAIQPLIVFAYLGILAVLYCRNNKAGTTVKLKISKTLGICAFIIVLCSGAALLRFDIKNIFCDAYFQTAMSREKMRANKQALSAGLEARAYNKYRMDVLTTVGRAYVTTGDLEKGIEALEEVIKKSPYNLNALFILGAAYTNAGFADKALDTFSRVLRIKPDFPEAKSIIASLKAYGRVKVNIT